MDTSLLTAALAGFESHLAAVGADQWGAPTPCTEWDVRALGNHVLGEVLWLTPLMQGLTMADVGDRFDGDVLGADPAAAWRSAATDAIAAASVPDALTRTVHLSFGDFPGRFYLGQVTTDLIIHTWDLARALGRDDRLDPASVAFAADELMPQIEQWRAAGVLAAAVDEPDDAEVSAQDRLLRATGRSPAWPG